MKAVLFICGRGLFKCTYRISEIIKSGDLPGISSVFAAFISHTLKLNNFIPTPASANKHICIPDPFRIYG